MSKGTARTGLICLTMMALMLISASTTNLQKAGALDGEGTMATPLTFWGQDTDGDSLYDYLWINVSFIATIQDAFRFDLRLNDSSNLTQIAHVMNDTYLLPGSHAVSMLVDGCYFNSTWKWDGPFVASVKVFNQPGRILAWASGMSPAYIASDFERPPATASKPYGAIGVDLDVPPDGLFNQLRISLSVNYTEADLYMLSVFISSPMPPFFPISSASLVVDAKVGEFTYDMALSGIPIRSSGIDGPYFENVCVWALPDPGQSVKVAFAFNNSPPYLASNFQVRPVVAVTGTVVDDAGNPLSGATVAFVNYTDLSYDQAITNPLGWYSKNLHTGDYVCIVTKQELSADNATRITVTGAGPYDFTIRNPPATVHDVSAVMSGADSVDWTMNESRSGAPPSARMMIDWDFGDRDGFVSIEESAMFARSIRQPQPTDDTTEGLLVDGTFYYPSNYVSNILKIDYTGPVLSQLPAERTESVHLSSNSTIPRQINHLIEVNVTYDRPDREGRMTLKLPPGWISTGYGAVPNVTVNGIDTDTVIFDPLGNPNPSGSPDFVWVDITAINTSLIPPTVQGQAATPDPQEYMQPVLVTAWINDSSPIAGVTVGITAPVSGSLGNFTMTYDNTSRKFTHELVSYSDLGTYSFMVWATDTDGNIASGGGAFVIRDTTAPVADAGPDQRVFVGTTVTFDGSGSVDNFHVGNWTWTFNDGIANVTMYGKTVAHGFDTAGIYLITLTVGDASGNQGTDTMTVVVEVDNVGNLGGFVNIPVFWILIIMLLNVACLIVAGVLAFVFAIWNRILRHGPLGSIASGLSVLATSFAFAVAFQAIVASGPIPLARVMLFANLSLQTLAFSFIAAGYGLWKKETKANWMTILLTSLLVFVAVLVALFAMMPTLMAQLEFSAMMKSLYGANLVLLGLVTATTLRSYIRRPQARAISIPAAFGLLSLGQCSLLVWSFDGGVTSIALASITALVGLSFLLRVALASRRATADG